MFADHDAVPFVRIHVTLSVLSSTVWSATLSEAFPVTVTVAKGTTLEFDGEGEVIVICGGGVSGFGAPGITATEIETDRRSGPPVPLMRGLDKPAGPPPIVQIATREPSMLDGAQATVRPFGEDADVRSTVPAKPAVDCKRIVVGAACPATKVTADGFARREKSGCGTGVTDTSIDAVWVRFPLVPWMTIVYDPMVV